MISFLKAKRHYLYLLLYVCLIQSNEISAQIIINELCPNNDTIIYDYHEESSDWIELFNARKIEVNLGNYYLSDDYNTPKKWKLPDVFIAPHQYLIVFASGKDEVYNGEIHTNFKLASKGEFILISNGDGDIIDSITFGQCNQNCSFARLPNLTGKPRYTRSATPKNKNHFIPQIFTSKNSGYYVDSFIVEFESYGDSVRIYYTLNGEEPNIDSDIYDSPIEINNANLLDDVLSLIPTTPQEGPERLDDIVWKTPVGKNRNAHVLRYTVFEDSLRSTPIFTNSYFIHNTEIAPHLFPVLSLNINADDLFDYKNGIYVPGFRFDNTPWNYWPRGNYNFREDKWERKVNVEYFTKDGEMMLNTMAGIKMHGYSSVSLAQKSFKLYFRKEYGLSKFEGNVFSNSSEPTYKRLIIRNGGNDFLKLHFRDALLQSLLDPIDIETQLFQPSCLYINGEYWGIHNVRERFDKHYFELQHGVPTDSLLIIGVCGAKLHGNSNEYRDMISFIETNDMSDSENYAIVKNQIDIENCIQYYLAQIYFANYDWPGNNYKMWKTTNPDSKWRWLVFDLDFSYAFLAESSVSANSIQNATAEGLTGWPNPDCSTRLLRNLLLNNEFKAKFIQTFDWQLKTIFKPDKVLAKIDSFQYLFEPEIQKHIDRWQYPSSVSSWHYGISVVKDFAMERPEILKLHFQDFFGQQYYDSILSKNENEVVLSTFNMHPNPNSNGLIKLYWRSFQNKPAHMSIINLSGVEVFYKYFESGVEHRTINLSHLKDGIYMVRIVFDDKAYTQRLILN